MDDQLKAIEDEVKQKEGVIRWRGVCLSCGVIRVSQYADVSRLSGRLVATTRCPEGCGDIDLHPSVLHFGNWVSIV